MNDELGNQLTDQWQIPSWARDRLWVSTAFESVAVSGANGAFRLTMPTDRVTVRWGSDVGVVLAQMRWRSDTLGWTGEVRVGGAVEAMHFIGADDEETTLAVVVVSGQPLLPGVRPYPLLGTGTDSSGAADFFTLIDREQESTLTTWLVAYASPLFVLCQDALSNKLNVAAWGRLVERSDGTKLLTPLQLHELTIFAT